MGRSIRCGAAGLVALTFLAACDQQKSQFVASCESKHRNLSCECVYDTAAAELSDEFLNVFLLAHSGDRSEAQRAFGELGFIKKATFTARSAELGIRVERTCRAS